VFALSGLGDENDVSRVKRGWWNKNVWETLFYSQPVSIACRFYVKSIPY